MGIIPNAPPPSEPTPREFDLFHLALGRFVHAFAEVETTLQGLVGETARTSKEMTRELFGNLTVNSAIDMLNRARRAQQRPECARLTRALDQLRDIARVRNRVLHQGARVFAGGSSQTLQGFARGRPTPFDVSPDRLWEMTQDLNTIRKALVAEVFEINLFPADDFAGVARGANAAWRYTPSA
ncbi:hypothetical protein [Sphingomonas sp.]|uniref:hypothetical protein n=1 Tax=Sphingomonas sp. TaxID=28214 RepID=UPI003F72A929